MRHSSLTQQAPKPQRSARSGSRGRTRRESAGGTPASPCREERGDALESYTDNPAEESIGPVATQKGKAASSNPKSPPLGKPPLDTTGIMEGIRENAVGDPQLPRLPLTGPGRAHKEPQNLSSGEPHTQDRGSPPPPLHLCIDLMRPTNDESPDPSDTEFENYRGSAPGSPHISTPS